MRNPLLLCAASLVLLAGCAAPAARPAQPFDWNSAFFLGLFAVTFLVFCLICAVRSVQSDRHWAAARTAEAHAKRAQAELEQARLEAGLAIAKETTPDA